MHRLRILHVVAPARFGGLERVVRGLVLGQLERGHAVRLLTILDVGTGRHPMVEAVEAAGVPVRSAEIPARRYGRERAEVRRQIVDLDAEIVHTHGARVDVVDAGVAGRLGIPMVTTVHGFTGGGIRNRLYEWVQVRAFRRFDAVVAVARSQLPRLRAGGVLAERLHCVRNAWSPAGPPRSRLEARAALDLPPARPVIGWVGRMTPVKGCDVFVRALAHLADSDAIACVVGDGPERAATAALAGRLGLTERMRWVGAVPDAGRLFAAFDVLVLSSRSEGTPMVLLEAAAAGTPLVATAVGGIPDVVSESEAILVPPECPAELAKGMRLVLQDPPAAARRAERARRRVAADHAVPPWLDAYDQVYRRVMARRRAVGS